MLFINLIRKFFFRPIWLVAVLVAFAAFPMHLSAAGTIAGTIVDADYGGVVSGATILNSTSGQEVRSNMNGRFFMSDVPEGECVLIVSADFYRSSRVEEVMVSSNEVTQIDIPLYEDNSDVVELDSFTVTAQVLQGSSMALLSQRRKSSSISDAIGSEDFGRLGVGDAADALSKTTGTSIVDGKYVVIRGLSDRYNNTTLNGSTVPSADPDKRAVQLDQFPSGIIESIVTTKSFTPDKSGSFTGGSVNVVTKSVPDAGFMTVSLGFGFNEKTSFSDYLSSSGGGKDWLASDDGTRAIPDLVVEAESIPTSPSGQTQEGLEFMDAIVRSFSPEMVPQVFEAPLNQSVSLAFGERYFIGNDADGLVLGIIGSLNYKRDYSAYDDGLVGRYEIVGRDLSLGASQLFDETRGVDSAQWGSVLNAALVLNENNEIGLKTMYNQSGEDEAILRVGEFPEAVAQDIFTVRNLHYTERALSSYQLYGEHQFESLNGTRLSWEIATSKSTQEEPDYRFFYDSTPVSSNGRPSYTGNFPPPRRYWRDLEETTDDYSFDVVVPLGEKASELKFGFRSIETQREFSERSFIYRDFSGEPYDGNAEAFLDSGRIGLSEDGVIQRYIREFVGFVPEYSGLMEVDAFYLMADLKPAEKLRFVLGARFEDAIVKVQSFQSDGSPFENDGDLDNADWLPAFQVVREIGENQNIRLAYSKTLARPNFRELSPFGSFDNVGGEVFIGNPDLRRTKIENIDIRYEWFLGDSDLVAVSVFQKNLEDPIELTYTEGQLTYANVPSGEVYGLELEARKQLPFLSGERHEVSLGGNLSLVESEVARSENELSDKQRRNPDVSTVREMQGQSAVVGNFDVLFSHYDLGSSFSLVYNHTGDRLYSVSDSALPDIYEEPSDSLDFVYSQKLKNGFSMKLALKNLLDSEKTRVWRDFSEDLIYSQSSSGRSVSISFSKRFE